MKRFFCLFLAVLLLIGSTGCKKDSDLLRPMTYDSFPKELTAHKIGTMPQVGTPTAGGVYYRIGNKYGIMSFDGSSDSGAIYAMCRPLKEYFLVAKTAGNTDDVRNLNTAGVVDAQGNVLVPLVYASVTTVDDRFARVAEITGKTDNKDASITNYKTDSGDTVYCTGNWYLYDLTTGKKIPDATGTKPYASYSYGGVYVKYVTDDKEQHIVTPEGKPLPADAVHLKNGYYVLEAENAVYAGTGTKLFTYDSNGYIPCDSQDVSGYIVAKKTIDGTDSYVLMNEQGSIVTGALAAAPKVCGELLLVGDKICNFKGEPLVQDECTALYMDNITKQCWFFNNSTTKERVYIQKDGTELYRSTDEDVVFNVNHFAIQKKDGDNRIGLSLKDGSFSIHGVALAPWLVRVEGEEGTFDLVDTISGETILSGYTGYTVSDPACGMLYVYASNAEGECDIFRIC